MPSQRAATARSTDGEIPPLTVACTGPRFTIELSGGQGWTFDESEETQRFTGAVIAHEVRVTIRSDTAIAAGLAGAPLRLGVASTPIALPPVETTVPLAVVTTGGLAKTYSLVFDRGAPELSQAAAGAV